MFLITQDNSSHKVNVWKFAYSPSATVHWFEVSSMDFNCYAQVKLSDNSLFFQGFTLSDYSLRIMKMSFGSTTADWSYYIQWPAASCKSKRGEAVINQDSSLIYSGYIENIQ